MSKFSEQVHISISSFDKNIVYYDLKLSQKMADHHYFSFTWQYTAKAVIDPEDQAKAIAKYVGSEVIFTFKVNGIRLMSKGIISGLESIDLHGSPAGLHVSGISQTVFLDDMEKSRIFLNRNLQQIALEIFAEESSGEFYQREAILPTYTSPFEFKPQYNETSFNFMKRLSARYGQWFYFDGMRMQFGQTKTSNVKLINGSSLHKFTIKANLVSQKTSFGGYDYNSESNIRNSSEKTTTGSRDRFAVSMGFNQSSVARKDLSVGAYTNNAQNKEELDQMVKLQTAGKDANSVFYSGISYFPIGLGQVFTIQNKTVEHELVAIEVIHHSEVNGNYSCEFRAIPADVAAPHYTDVNVFAVAESQPAKVIDNNDPESLGRVKVQYYWNGWGCESTWMRMIQPHSGAGKGFYFIPEIGEEVLVGFEGGNADCPFVMGTQYNGQASSGYHTPKNDIKAIHTRSGHIIKFTEDESIIITDKSGNEIHLDTAEGNINIKAPKVITMTATDIIMNASQNISSTAGMNISEDAGLNHISKAGASMMQSAEDDYLLRAKNITKLASENYSADAKDISRNASGKIQSISFGDHTQNSKGKFENNSGENSTNC